uniref:Uncharacterized protein n=1 Tax=Oryza glumipatula TaxID=40148 RepID=A0A0E0ALV3_9ORYZ
MARGSTGGCLPMGLATTPRTDVGRGQDLGGGGRRAAWICSAIDFIDMEGGVAFIDIAMDGAEGAVDVDALDDDLGVVDQARPLTRPICFTALVKICEGLKMCFTRIRRVAWI